MAQNRGLFEMVTAMGKSIFHVGYKKRKENPNKQSGFTQGGQLLQYYKFLAMSFFLLVKNTKIVSYYNLDLPSVCLSGNSSVVYKPIDAKLGRKVGDG